MDRPHPAHDIADTGESLEDLRDAASHCTACELYRNATQTVFGSGTSKARLMIVGEQPGNSEDIAGVPFVGPAGALLDIVLEELDIPSQDVYKTNVVKHFRWREGGKKRLHQKPATRHVSACLPWFAAEVQSVDPAAIVCLGATAAEALLGRDFRVTRDHGVPLEWRGRVVVATIHPSAILRAWDRSERERLRQMLSDDIDVAKDLAS